MSENVEQINIQSAKINSIAVDKLITNMAFTPLDDFLIRGYRYSFVLSLLFGLFFALITFVFIKDFEAISFWFNMVIVSFIGVSFFLLFLFVYKVLMVNLYVKVRRDIKSFDEYNSFIKILLINSYQVFSYEDLQSVMKSVKENNQGKSSFTLGDMFTLNGDDKVLMAISNFRLKKSLGQEKF